jgi:hypothetical protein
VLFLPSYWLGFTIRSYAWTNIMFIDEEDDAIVVELYGAVLLGS